MQSSLGIAILIPTYNRPDLLGDALLKWLSVDSVSSVLVVAEASEKSIYLTYQELFASYNNDHRVDYRLTMNRLGSVNARNALLELARKNKCDFAVMVDDDYMPTKETSLKKLADELQKNKAGLIGGKVVVIKKRKDPDFFLNLPINVSDSLSKLIGYVFLDTVHGPRYCAFMPHFFMIPKVILDQPLRYDVIYETPTGFREESDFQLQVRSKGYALIFEPTVSVIHLAAEVGGDRPGMSESKRMYWKARNHQVFITKWNKSLFKRIWFTFTGLITLSIYRVWAIPYIFQGIRDGFLYSHGVKK